MAGVDSGIRPASEADVPQLLSLLRDCVVAMRAAGIEQWDEVYPDEVVVRGDLAAGTLHVLPDDVPGAGGMAGCVTVDRRPDPLWEGLAWGGDGAPFVAVHRLMVHPSRQGRGLAKRLMAHVEVLAAAAGCRWVRLDTFTRNPAALALYERLGYRRTGFATMRKGLFVGMEKRIGDGEG